MMIKGGKIQKANKKSLKAKGKNKVNGKGKDKEVYIPKLKNHKPTAIKRPAKDDTCHHYKEVGHCKRNCPAYLAELIKKKKQVGTASSSDVWGCEALEKRDTPDKLEQRSVKCIFIGYLKETMGYYFYFPHENKIVVARNQDEDTSPSEITSKIPMEVEGFEPYQGGKIISIVGAVDWKSSKQSTTAMSATESEYIAASEAAMEAVWIRKFISGLGARHYQRRYHYVRECVELGEIRILKVHTDNNLVDPFTKALSNRKLTQHARGMGLRPASVEASLHGPVGLCKWASIFVNVWLSSAPSRVSEAVAGLVLPLCSLTQLSFVCQPKDSDPYLIQHLVGHGTSYSGPDMSFNTSASPEYMSSLGSASLAKMSIYDFMTLPSWENPKVVEEPYEFTNSIFQRVQNYTTTPVAEGAPISLPTLKELVVGQPDLKLAKKSKAPVKRKTSASLRDEGTSSRVISAPSLHLSKRLGSPPRLSHVGFSDPSHVGTSDAANVYFSRRADVQKGVVAIGVVGKARAKVICRQLDPMDVLARSALARDHEYD
ncbi:retrotransposon protein, putative, ty1-copia subclass [Tanacetum coccineum]